MSTRLWDNVGGVPYLVNPPSRKRSAKPKKKRRRASAAQLRARKKRGRAARAAKRSSARTARRRTATEETRQRQGTAMAARKRRKARSTGSRRRRRSGVRRRRRGTSVAKFQGYGRVRVNRGRRRRVGRRYRRNPGLGSVKGIVGQVVDAGKETFFILGGKIATNFIAAKIPFGDNSNQYIVAAKKVAVGVGLAMVGKRFVGPKNARALLIGAMLAPGEELLSSVDALRPYLSATPMPVPVPTGTTGTSGYSMRGYSRAAIGRGRATDPYAAFATTRR